MFGKRFLLNDETLSVIEEIGRHMPGGFFIYEWNILLFFWKKYLQNGSVSVRMVQHGLIPMTLLHHTPGDRVPKCHMAGCAR